MKKVLFSTPQSATTQRLRGGHKALRKTRFATTALLSILLAINLAALITASSEFFWAHLAAILLASYLLLEARRYLSRTDTFGLLSPALLALPFHFVLSYLLGISAATIHPWVMQRFSYWLPDLDATLANTMLLATVAAFCMLRGYSLAQPLGQRLRRAVRRSSLIRQKIRPNLPLVVVIQAAHLVAVAYAIHLGAYGLLSTRESLEEHASIVQFLNMFLAAGTLSYFLILFRFFQLRDQGQASPILWIFIAVIIALHIGTGVLSGFKSQIVLPFVIAAVAYFLATRRVPVHFIGLSVAALIAAYVVIEPYRAYIETNGQPPASAAEAVKAFSNALEIRQQLTHDSNITRSEAIASRFDLAGMTALAINYVERGELKSETRRQFQNSILFAPVLAYVPRAVWPSKPSYSEGLWFNQEVLGDWQDQRTSVGMGPIGYLYISGGLIAVILGFFGLGIIQALVFDGLARGGAGGLIIFLAVAITLVFIPSSYGPALTGVLRMLPIALVSQFILLRQNPLTQPNRI